MTNFRKSICLAAILLLNLAMIPDAFSCRYTVREIGFTDLAADVYHLYFYTNQAVEKEKTETFQRISRAVLFDVNIVVETIDIDETRNHSAMDVYRLSGLNALPAAVLVSPEGQSMPLIFADFASSFKESVWSMLEKIIISPAREKMLKSIVKSLSIVLLVEGNDPAKNHAARQMAESAIERVRKIIPQLPKPVDAPPELIIIPFSEAPDEKVLIWSVGLYDKPENEPGAAILYGRGRRMGPPLGGKSLNEQSLFNLLGLVGADCECGLDRSWLLGLMLPLRWTSDARKEIVQRLGFDAENPMVKSEMSKILSLGTSARSTRDAGSGSGSGENLFYGYSEQVVEFETQQNAPKMSFSQLQAMNSPATSGGMELTLKIALYSVGCLVLLILIGTAVIYVRTKRKRV
ncbi:hypothetical protein JXJ21_04810 [candidate division KSB1 bacterium]|nr:hypothetical protein [candidate division KSB1 bacterium]